MLTNQMENSKNTTAIGLNNDLAMVFMVNDLKIILKVLYSDAMFRHLRNC